MMPRRTRTAAAAVAVAAAAVTVGLLAGPNRPSDAPSTAVDAPTGPAAPATPTGPTVPADDATAAPAAAAGTADLPPVAVVFTHGPTVTLDGVLIAAGGHDLPGSHAEATVWCGPEPCPADTTRWTIGNVPHTGNPTILRATHPGIYPVNVTVDGWAPPTRQTVLVAAPRTVDWPIDAYATGQTPPDPTLTATIWAEMTGLYPPCVTPDSTRRTCAQPTPITLHDGTPARLPILIADDNEPIDGTRCDLGWHHRRTPDGWTLTEGPPPGCLTVADATQALTRHYGTPLEVPCDTDRCHHDRHVPRHILAELGLPITDVATYTVVTVVPTPTEDDTEGDTEDDTEGDTEADTEGDTGADVATATATTDTDDTGADVVTASTDTDTDDTATDTATDTGGDTDSDTATDGVTVATTTSSSAATRGDLALALATTTGPDWARPSPHPPLTAHTTHGQPITLTPPPTAGTPHWPDPAGITRMCGPNATSCTYTTDQPGTHHLRIPTHQPDGTTHTLTALITIGPDQPTITSTHLTLHPDRRTLTLTTDQPTHHTTTDPDRPTRHDPTRRHHTIDAHPNDQTLTVTLCTTSRACTTTTHDLTRPTTVDDSSGPHPPTVTTVEPGTTHPTVGTGHTITHDPTITLTVETVGNTTLLHISRHPTLPDTLPVPPATITLTHPTLPDTRLCVPLHPTHRCPPNVTDR